MQLRLQLIRGLGSDGARSIFHPFARWFKCQLASPIICCHISQKLSETIHSRQIPISTFIWLHINQHHHLLILRVIRTDLLPRISYFLFMTCGYNHLQIRLRVGRWQTRLGWSNSISQSDFGKHKNAISVSCKAVSFFSLAPSCFTVCIHIVNLFSTAMHVCPQRR